jgi:hypothetical protein
MVSNLLDENTANIEKAKSLTAGLSAAQIELATSTREMVHRTEPGSPDRRLPPGSRHPQRRVPKGSSATALSATAG